VDTVRWLLVGAGDIARKRVASALAEAMQSEIVAVCDMSPESAQSLALEYGVKEIFTDLGQALEESSADAVYVATPVCFHVQQAIQSMKAGYHVLVEKPLGLSARDCEPALVVAEQSGKVAGCSYYRRFFPAYQQAQKMIEMGEFGQVVLVRMTYFSWFNPTADDPKHWRVVRERAGGGPLSDMGTHMFDVLIGLFGLPASVYARCGNLVHQWNVEDCASLVMQLQDGAQVVASFHWNSRTWRHEFEIVGTEAKVYWHPYDSGQVIKTVGRQVDTLDLRPNANAHLPLIEDFVQAILEGRPPACPLSEALKTNVLLDAVYRSAAGDRAIVL
jgi:1,5-anhydro-D-fructose reductase (1,5-anhydro-D-mannitol-forming)